MALPPGKRVKDLKTPSIAQKVKPLAKPGELSNPPRDGGRAGPIAPGGRCHGDGDGGVIADAFPQEDRRVAVRGNVEPHLDEGPSGNGSVKPVKLGKSPARKMREVRGGQKSAAAGRVLPYVLFFGGRVRSADVGRARAVDARAFVEEVPIPGEDRGKIARARKSGGDVSVNGALKSGFRGAGGVAEAVIVHTPNNKRSNRSDNLQSGDPSRGQA